MSVHAIYPCHGCKGSFAFPEFHWPHCPGNPKNLTGAAKVIIESKFSKAELEAISKHGPVKDEKLTSRRRGKRA